MIPLNLRIEFDGDQTTPFVIRLCESDLVGDLQEMSVFETPCGRLIFPNCPATEVLGDVLFVEPLRKNAARWIRKNSQHNTLLVTERCDQLCVMCSQPPKKTHSDHFKYFYEACILADKGVVIGFSGGEPTFYKEQLFDLLLRLHSERPDLAFHVLTNGQHFTKGDISCLKTCDRVLWGIPLYSHKSEIHDSIVKKRGAYERLEASFKHLLLAGASIELRTVILKDNYFGLPKIAQKIHAHLPFISTWALMQLEHIGFAKNRWNDLFVNHADEIEPLTNAVMFAMARGINTQLYNFPLCTLPRQLWPYAPPTISDWKQRYLKACKNCSKNLECSGVFEWNPDERSYGDLTPI